MEYFVRGSFVRIWSLRSSLEVLCRDVQHTLSGGLLLPIDIIEAGDGTILKFVLYSEEGLGWSLLEHLLLRHCIRMVPCFDRKFKHFRSFAEGFDLRSMLVHDLLPEPISKHITCPFGDSTEQWSRSELFSLTELCCCSNHVDCLRSLLWLCISLFLSWMLRSIESNWEVERKKVVEGGQLNGWRDSNEEKTLPGEISKQKREQQAEMRRHLNRRRADVKLRLAKWLRATAEGEVRKHTGQR